jgi:hypothetical protein
LYVYEQYKTGTVLILVVVWWMNSVEFLVGDNSSSADSIRIGAATVDWRRYGRVTASPRKPGTN